MEVQINGNTLIRRGQLSHASTNGLLIIYRISHRHRNKNDFEAKNYSHNYSIRENDIRSNECHT